MSKLDTELLDAYIADAMRYRWLRDEIGGGNEAFADVYIRRRGEGWDEVQVRRGADLDAAVDAALSKVIA